MEISSPASILFEVYIDPDLCNNCNQCIDLCSMGVFVKTDEGVYPARSNICCSCFCCNQFCPEQAISTRWIVRA